MQLRQHWFATKYTITFPRGLPQVTRKIIRKCFSADGAEREEVTLEGAPQASIGVAEGDGYSKVVKRTVLKSEGEHTEVCVLYMLCVLCHRHQNLFFNRKDESRKI